MSVTGRTPGARFATLQPRPSRVVESDYQSALPGHLTVSPTTAFAATGPLHGPFSPATKVFTLSNDGGLPLDWSVTVPTNSGGAWMVRSANSGTIAPGATATVTISLDANALSAGAYTGSIIFNNDSLPMNSTTVAASLAISSPP